MLKANWRRRMLLAVIVAVIVAGVLIAIVPSRFVCGISCAARAAARPPVTPSQRPTATPTPDAMNPVRVADLVEPVDALRVRSGCHPLVRNDVLRRSARARARALAERGGVSHVDSVGGTAQDRVSGRGYRGNVIELVATGTLRPDEFTSALGQLVRRTELLDCRFRSVGAAVADQHLVMVLGDR